MKKHRALRIWRNVLLTVLTLALLIAAGAVCYLRFPARAFYQTSKKAFLIPGLDSGFIPQGLSYDEGTDCFFVCGYQNDHSASRVYIVDRASGETRAWARLQHPDGSALTDHCGGLSVYGGNVYLAGNHGLYAINESVLLNASAGSPVTYDAWIPTLLTEDDELTVAFTDARDGLLTTGEFYREPQYPTPDSHKYTLDDGTLLQALCVTWQLSEDGLALTPVAAYCLPDLAQGISIDDGRLRISTSWGLGTSHLLTFDLNALEPFSTLTVDGVDVPLTALDPKLALSDKPLPAMAEEIDVVDGRVYIMTESASAKYRFGILTGGRWCHSLAID